MPKAELNITSLPGATKSDILMSRLTLDPPAVLNGGYMELNSLWFKKTSKPGVRCECLLGGMSVERRAEGCVSAMCVCVVLPGTERSCSGRAG